jgi:hypothetical protein
MKNLLTGNYRADMIKLGQYIQRILEERSEAMQMMLCEAAHFPDLQQVLGQIPLKLRNMVAGYFRQRIEAGDIMARDPDLMAQAFLGFFFSYSIGLNFLDRAMELALSREEMVAEFVDLFLLGTIKGA